MQSEPTPEKQAARDKIASDVAEFMSRGGSVQHIAADVIDRRSHNEKTKNFKESHNGIATGKTLDPK